MALLGPRLVSIPDSCGCNLTKATITPLTLDLIEAMGSIEYNREQMLMRMMESRAVGVPVNYLYDLLRSRMRTSGADGMLLKDQIFKRTVGRSSIVAPFKYRRRTRNWNAAYFTIQSGAASALAGTTVDGVTYGTGAWAITVVNNGAEFASALPDIVRYFKPGNYLYLQHLGSGDVAVGVHARIVAAEAITSTSARVTINPPFTNAQWTALSAANKAKYNPTSQGIVELLSNNISDYESWCVNQPFNNSEEMVVDWFQTSRFTRCKEKEYEEMLARIMNGEVNQFTRMFEHTPVAERNRQERMQYDKELMNTFFWGQRISPYQEDDIASSDFTNLEAVTDPEDATCVLEYKAGAVGVWEQLVENTRVVDLQNTALNLDDVFEMTYSLKRHRALDGQNHDTVVYMTDRLTKDRIDQAMTAYLRDRYGVTDLVRYVETGKLIDQVTQAEAWRYTTYDVPQHAFRIGIITDTYFDDRVDAFNHAGPGGGGIPYRGRMFMSLDWSDIHWNVYDTNTVQREYKGETTANANSTWSCVMKLNTKTYDLESTTWGVEIGDPNRSIAFFNFSDSCPTLSSYPCEPTTS